MGQYTSSLVRSGASALKNAQLELNRDKPLQITKFTSISLLLVAVVAIIIGAATNKEKVPPEWDDTKQQKKLSGSAVMLITGGCMLLAGVIGLVVYNMMATIRHPKAFAVEQTAAVMTSIV